MAGISRVSGNAFINAFINPEMEFMKVVMQMEDNCQILRTDMKPMESLLHDTAAILFRDEVDIAAFFQGHDIATLEGVKTWLQLLHNSLTEAERLLCIDNWGRRQRCLDFIVNNPRRPSKQIRHWNAFFDHLYRCFQSEFSILVTSLQFVSAKPLYKEEALLQGVAASASVTSRIIDSQDEEETDSEESIEIQPFSQDEEEMDSQPLSQDEAWMLFRRVAFEDDKVPVDIEGRARNVADECKGMPLTIKVVAAAMMGKTSSVDEWDICLASMRNIDPSFPAATQYPSHLDAQLYARLRYAYDALPNSHVKRCFLYCAMYQQDAIIDPHTLLQMWIGEGLVKSKQGTYLMDMAIARKYLKFLVDRFFLKRVSVFVKGKIIVDKCIHDMAVYIGQKEENCLFMGSEHQLNFPVVDNEHCSRISVANNSMQYLPTELKCSKLVILSLQGNLHLKELPSEFLLSVTSSLRVLNLSGCTQITSIPTSIGQLRMLECLSFRGLSIKDLPGEICRLSKLQFLDLSECHYLNSLPSQIGQLRNLKDLNLYDSLSLEMIPREMSELTSLSRLQLWTKLSVEMGAPASIWSLKGLKSLTELQILISTRQQDRENSSIKDGIMGTWLEMRHLELIHIFHGNEEIRLPEDMQNMKKLQSFTLQSITTPFLFQGLSLFNCKFEHLEMVRLNGCYGIRELSPLEGLPNLKRLELQHCDSLRELGIGSPNGYISLQKLVLKNLNNLKCLDGGSNREAWDERTLPQLRVLKIWVCPDLKRFPKGIEKLRNLSAVKSTKEWWKNIMWEDDDMKGKLQKIFCIPRLW